MSDWLDTAEARYFAHLEAEYYDRLFEEYCEAHEEAALAAMDTEREAETAT